MESNNSAFAFAVKLISSGWLALGRSADGLDRQRISSFPITSVNALIDDNFAQAVIRQHSSLRFLPAFKYRAKISSRNPYVPRKFRLRTKLSDVALEPATYFV